MAIKLFTAAQKTVTTAGTRVQVSATSLPCTTIIVQADPANTNKIYVGDASVSATQASAALSAGQSYTLTADASGREGWEEFDLQDLYLDAGADAQKAFISYVKRR